jgi:hypothetical protein
MRTQTPSFYEGRAATKRNLSGIGRCQQTYTFAYTLSQCVEINPCKMCILQIYANNLKSAARKGVGVQVPLRAPLKTSLKMRF